MQSLDPKAILAKLAEQNLRVDSFFLRRTGFAASQTILKLGEYNLNCVPASFGPDQARFLVALTANEVNLFSKFKEGLYLLMLTFDHPDSTDIARFPLRVGVLDISTVPDRKDICFLTLKLRSLPTEFVLFLGAYLEDLEIRAQAWEALSAEALPYTTELVLAVGLGYGAVLVAGENRYSVEVVEFHTKRIGLRTPEITETGAAQLRLVYQGRPLNLAGTLEAGGFLPEFNPDWLDFVQQVLLRKKFQSRAAGTAS